MKKTGLALALAACILCTGALAETISFSGTVESGATALVYAPLNSTVEEVPVEEGQAVTADTVIARLKTTKVYAPEDGTITAVFGEPGDDVTSVTERYGGVMYLEGPYTLQISTTTSKAYEEKENFIVHPGETVYVVSRSRNTNKGKGVITTVDGSSYTVLISEGNFMMGDSVNICRKSNYSLLSSLGRGTIARVSPTALTGSGTLVSCAVQAGDQVKKGQLLFETVEGSYEGADWPGTEIKAGTDGIVSSLSVSAGTTVSQSSVIAQIYPKDAVRVKAEVTESDLKDLAVGQKVKVELDWNLDLGVSYEGVIEMISALGTVGEESTTYPVYVSFTPDENTRYNMSAVITTLDHSPAGTADPEPAVMPEEEGEPCPDRND